MEKLFERRFQFYKWFRIKCEATCLSHMFKEYLTNSKFSIIINFVDAG